MFSFIDLIFLKRSSSLENSLEYTTTVISQRRQEQVKCTRHMLKYGRTHNIPVEISPSSILLTQTEADTERALLEQMIAAACKIGTKAIT